MNTHPSDTQQVIPVTITEEVQVRSRLLTRERHTVQDISKLPRLYTLAGETMAQKVESLRAWVASRPVYFHFQLELLAYLGDILAAPTSLETVDVDNLPLETRPNDPFVDPGLEIISG